MTADVDLKSATKALQKVVGARSQERSDLLQLEEQLQMDEQDDQPIIELVVSDFGGPPPHKRLHRTDGKKKHHHHHHDDDQDDEKAKQAKDQADQDVDSKQFDPDDLEAYTANAVNNNFNEVRRKGLAARDAGDKKSAVDLATTLSEAGKKTAEKATPSSQEATKANTAEDNVAKAFSEPTVQQVSSSPEPVAVPAASVGQKLSQDTEQSSHTPKEPQESTEAPKSPPVEQKKSNNAPLATSKLEKSIAQHEKEDAVPEKDKESSSSSVDDITAYSQYLDSSLGTPSSSGKDPVPTSPLASQAMQVSREQSPSEQAPPEQSPEEQQKRAEAAKAEKILQEK